MEYGEHYNYQRALLVKLCESIRNDVDIFVSPKCNKCGKETLDLECGICDDCWEEDA